MNIVYAALVRMPTEKAHGIQIMKTCSALAGEKVSVELVVPTRNTNSETSPFAYYKVPENFSITKLPSWDFISRGWFGAADYWLYSYFFTRAVRGFLKKSEQGTVLFTRDLLLAVLLSKTSVPVFYEIHTVPKKIASIHRAAWKRVQGIVVISDGLRAALIADGVPAEKIVVARDSVDVAQFQNIPSRAECREKLNIPLEQKIVVYTGHLYDWKGADTLALAAEKLAQENIHVYLVGGTEADVRAFKNKFTSSNLHIIGHRQHEEIPLWLGSADLLVIPNSAKQAIGALYTSPLKLFEYIVAGKPIVASDVPAIKEVLPEGTFAEPDNADSLADAIKDGLKNYEANLAVAKKLTTNVDQYAWKERAHTIIDFITKHS